MSFGAYAQSARHAYAAPAKAIGTEQFRNLSRTTAIGSTDTLENITGTDTLALYLAGMSDTGFAAGTDIYEDMGFAERYDINTTATDSTVKVIGVVSLFGGTVSPSSTHSVVFNVWTVAAQSAISGLTNVYESGLPNTSLTTQSVPFTALGINATTDTPKIFMFATPTAALTSSFFIGFTINYTWAGLAGDTIGLYSSRSPYERTSPAYTISGADTIVNNQNVTEYSDNSWNDNGTSNFGLFYDYFLFPIVQVGSPTSVSGITRGNLTFFGNYPNPARDNTNIRFAVSNSTVVTITITDMAGHTVRTISAGNMAAGEHIVNINTSALAAGDYIYVVRTSAGAGMAGKMNVVK